MPRRRRSVAPLTELQVLTQHIANLQRQVDQLSQAGIGTVHAIDKDFYITPVQGEVEFNYPWARGFIWHNDKWHPLLPPTLYIKLQKDTKETEVTEDNFKFMIGRDMHGYYLIDAEAYITTSGSITIDLRNNTQGGADMLNPSLVVNSGQKNTKNSTPKRGLVDHQVAHGDEIEVMVTAVGGSAMGAGVMLTFSAKRLLEDLDA